MTLAYLRLGKIEASDAAGYVAAQCAGAIAGVELSRRLLGEMVAHPAVGYAVTVPGAAGSAAAFLAELAISFLLMTVVLLVSNSRWSRWTGACCGTLVFLYITFEAPLSGMSMNPARTLGSAYVSHVWTSWWIYLLAPPLGMLTAVELYRRSFAMRACANLNHGNGSTRPCHFCKPLAH